MIMNIECKICFTPDLLFSAKKVRPYIVPGVVYLEFAIGMNPSGIKN